MDGKGIFKTQMLEKDLTIAATLLEYRATKV
jgi:hypothetical protein